MTVTDARRVEVCRAVGLPDSWAQDLRGGNVEQLVEHGQRLADRVGVGTGGSYPTPEAAVLAQRRDAAARLRRVMH